MSTAIPEVSTMADIPSIPPAMKREIETAYRRGYLHGYSAAIDDRQRFTLKRMLAFLNGALSRWRYGNVDRIETPPELKRKGQQ